MMPTMITLPQPSSAERNRLLPADAVRRRALERLYERREAVRDLIRALEDYQKSQQTCVVQCISFNVGRRCRSSFAQSQI
jgi:hypothetical protein